jgi:hypothetical protein
MDKSDEDGREVVMFKNKIDESTLIMPTMK